MRKLCELLYNFMLSYYFTYNLRHCDLVQLHGFLGLIPFGSTLVYDL